MAYTGSHGYYTAILPLTSYPKQGDTEFGLGKPFYTLAGAKAHRGDVPHRGGANMSRHTRVALALIYSDKPDANRDPRKARSFT